MLLYWFTFSATPNFVFGGLLPCAKNCTLCKNISHGYYRDVFGIRILKETVVFKTHSLYMRYKHQRLEQVRIDALVMERLTSAPNIVDIYGFTVSVY